MNPLTVPPAPASRSKAIVIACQGGGSHTAFAGGVLQTLLSALDRSRYRIAGLSGTSGGALCAAIAWFGLLQDDPKHGAQLLESFWQEISARQPMDAFSNTFLVLLQRSAGYLALPEISPYQVPATGQDYLASVIERHIDFAQVRKSLKPDSPRLMVGAVEVRSGEFTAFHSHHAEPEKQISVEALLASAAIPELFRAVEVGSEHPLAMADRVRRFLAGLQDRDDKPDEIWVIQINPDKRDTEPRLTSDITDRRNELAGNLSLKQELFFVEQANDWLARGWLTADHFKHVEVRRLRLSRELDYPSKLDRSPSFINGLLDEGRRAGADFLDQLGKTGT